MNLKVLHLVVYDQTCQNTVIHPDWTHVQRSRWCLLIMRSMSVLQDLEMHCFKCALYTAAVSPEIFDLIFSLHINSPYVHTNPLQLCNSLLCKACRTAWAWSDEEFPVAAVNTNAYLQSGPSYIQYEWWHSHVFLLKTHTKSMITK